eukprot:CAMPEP_0115536586 /NCGR_PEP_ID=MMETSP0271-20121206/87853_1 /TAXON_ID=71861 /ORGANISM="Scrippsiella trochoidea, Strain CCMP3099" /LENGTH=516 /DNA_ID=CAMNT_0002969283 /DNA_START=57 /DNA_END=1605 /DNA_ORIENTATION=-
MAFANMMTMAVAPARTASTTSESIESMSTPSIDRLQAMAGQEAGPVPRATVGTPLRALRERLEGTDVEECPWLGYLPVRYRENLQIKQASFKNAAAERLTGVALVDRPVIGRVWTLSQDAVGCRDVQRALEGAGSDVARQAIALELHGRVWEALHCPHANHVLQKCILTLRPEASQFIVDELGQGRVLLAAQHKYGCRIVQKVIEFLTVGQTIELVERLLQEVQKISRHAYGNYVIQHLLQHGTRQQRERILKTIACDVRGFAMDPYGVAVIGAVLQHGSAFEKCELSAALVAEDEKLLLSMACLRLGHSNIRWVLDALSPEAQLKAMQHLRSQASVLRSSRFGRQVLEHLQTDAQRQVPLPQLSPALPRSQRWASGHTALSWGLWDYHLRPPLVRGGQLLRAGTREVPCPAAWMTDGDSTTPSKQRGAAHACKREASPYSVHKKERRPELSKIGFEESGSADRCAPVSQRCRYPGAFHAAAREAQGPPPSPAGSAFCEEVLAHVMSSRGKAVPST